MTKTLGEGTFGKVKLAEHQATGQQYAIKILDKSDIKAHELTINVRREIAIMKALNHRNIVNLREVLSSKTKLYIVMDLVRGGELFEMIEKQGELSEKLARKYFQQLVDGVEYCHRRGVVHRDLKPENLLVDANGTLKITDFGVSSMKGLGQDLLYTACGTPYYAAPEILVGGNNGYNGQKVDAWSCGVILFLLLSGQLPFMEEDMNKLYEDIKAVRIEWPSEIKGEPKQLIMKLLTKDPDKRYDLADVKRNNWFNADYEENLREFEAIDTGMVPRALSSAPHNQQQVRERTRADPDIEKVESVPRATVRTDSPANLPAAAQQGFPYHMAPNGTVPGNLRPDGYDRGDPRLSQEHRRDSGPPSGGSAFLNSFNAGVHPPYHPANGEAHAHHGDGIAQDSRYAMDRNLANGYDDSGSGTMGLASGGSGSVGLGGGNSGNLGLSGSSMGHPKDYKYILEYYEDKKLKDFISDALPGKPEKKILEVTQKLESIDVDCVQDIHVLVESTGNRHAFVRWFEQNSQIPSVTAMRIAKLFFD
eukprot:CAMPEP_0184686000 /NCGR_PEP_ID=MMETSP0312-20130426/20978_1 /TAXON_ID=31354 /ORGANISM="Compsopogon coeruleus, Strain SAG 36.94" /LENGTH=534 /DNA_ID=CAMNT_0027140657 /DNA_START=538 /DNA_END=2142 /DNA_ORIENTATION=-